MILVDTSIWSKSLANRAPFAREFGKLLFQGEVAGNEFIYGELLIGDSGGRSKLLGIYKRIHFAKTVSNENVAAFVQARALGGRGIGWIDAHLLAAALAGGYQLWTADSRLAALAQELGVSYEVNDESIQ